MYMSNGTSLQFLNGKKKVDYLEENDGLERRDTQRRAGQISVG
jgi:hypothetical protein